MYRLVMQQKGISICEFFWGEGTPFLALAKGGSFTPHEINTN